MEAAKAAASCEAAPKREKAGVYVEGLLKNGGPSTDVFKKGIGDEIRSSTAVILGVSAGSSNMARRALDIWESHVPYEGLGLVDITIKAHVTPDDRELLHTLMQISRAHDLPICAMADESAIFVQKDVVTHLGQIQYIGKGEIKPFTPELLCR